jgi:hypothetical protein
VHSLKLQLDELRKFLDRHSDNDIKNAIVAEEFSSLVHLPAGVREAIESNPDDIWTDIWWYIDIRNETKLDDFPCVHVAYAASAKANFLIGRSHGVFAINSNEMRNEGIVIAFCPWCAKPLSVNARNPLKRG